MVTLKISGEDSSKYMVPWWAINIVMYAIYIFNVIVPFGKKFISILELQLNSKHWDLIPLLTPIFWMFIYYIATQVILGVIVWFIFKSWKSKH